VLGQETIEQVRRQTSLVAVIQQVVRLQRRGRSFVGLCPFHKEKTPSFHVNDERGFYHCFGCKASGDVIKFVQETQGVTFAEAIRELADRAGIEIVEERSAEDSRARAESRRRLLELYEVGNAAASFFEQALRDHPLRGQAVAELARRSLVASTPTDSIADALQAFRVGYAPYGWDELLRHLRSLGFSMAAAESVGLAVPRRSSNGHYDRFRHRLMFAVLDIQGRVIAFSGRALPEPDPSELNKAGLAPTGESDTTTAKAKYVNSPESPIYKKRETLFGLYQARQALREQGRALLVEGNFDVVSLHAHGLHQAVAPLGTAFTLEQAKLLRRLTPDMTLMFDGDAAGRRAVRAAREVVREAGLGCQVAALPDGQDPDDLVRRGGAQSVMGCVQAAKGLLEYLIDTCLESGFIADDAITQAAKIKEVAELIASENDVEIRAMAERYADRIAERLGIADARTFRALNQLVRQAATEAGKRAANGQVNANQARSPIPSDAVAREVLGCVLDWPELLREPEFEDAFGLIEGDIALALALARRVFLGQKADCVEEFLAKIPVSIHAFAASRLAAPRHNRLEDARTVLLKNVSKLMRLEQHRRRPQDLEAIQRAAASGDFDAELALLRRHERLARVRHGVGER
jgi:DNA primase